MASDQSGNTFSKCDVTKKRNEKNVRKINFKQRDRANKPFHANSKSNARDKETSKNKNGFGSYKAAFVEYENIKSKRKGERELAHKRKTEIKLALEKYKQNKRNKFKKLSAKTSKGQPIMKNRIEMLLEKIQSTVT